MAAPITATTTTNGHISDYDLDAHFATFKTAAQVQAEAAQKAVAAAQTAAEAEPVRTFIPLSLDDLLNLPSKEWMIDQLVGPGDIGMVYGAPGCGKTFVVIDLIMAACTGNRWAMRFDIGQPLNVAYCAGEGVSGLPARFAAAAQHHGVTALDNFTFFRNVPQLYVDNQAAMAITIDQFVREWQARQEQGQAQPLDILVIDTLHTATTDADENSAKDMGKVLSACRVAAHALGCAVILVHHTNKNGTAERGSSAMRGAFDFMVEVKRVGENGTKGLMHCAKLKDGEAWKDQTFDLTAMGESVRVWWDEPSDNPTSRESGKQHQDIEAIIGLLQGKPSVRYTAKAIAENIGMAATSTQVFKLLKIAGERDTNIKSGLKNPDKDTHSTNPTMYWYSPD